MEAWKLLCNMTSPYQEIDHHNYHFIEVIYNSLVPIFQLAQILSFAVIL